MFRIVRLRARGRFVEWRQRIQELIREERPKRPAGHPRRKAIDPRIRAIAKPVVLDRANHSKPSPLKEGTRIRVGEPPQMSAVVDAAVALGPASAYRELHEGVIEAYIRQTDDSGRSWSQQPPNGVQHDRGLDEVLEYVGTDHTVELLTFESLETFQRVIAYHHVELLGGRAREIRIDFYADDIRAKALLQRRAERAIGATDVEYSRRTRWEERQEIGPWRGVRIDSL